MLVKHCRRLLLSTRNDGYSTPLPWIFLVFSLVHFSFRNTTIRVNRFEIATLSFKCWKLCLKDSLNYIFCVSNGRLKVQGEQNRVAKNARTAHAQKASFSIHTSFLKSRIGWLFVPLSPAVALQERTSRLQRTDLICELSNPDFYELQILSSRLGDD